MRLYLIVASLSACVLVLWGPPAGRAAPPSPSRERERAGRLMGALLTDERGPYAIVQSLTDTVGARLSGSPGDAQAVRWGLAEMQRAGLKNVRAEKVMVPAWERGPRALEYGEVLAPVRQRVELVALGGSVGTGPAGVSAEVVEATSFDHIKQLGRDRVAGRIVLWNVIMKRGEDGMSNYGEVARYRHKGATEAARLGAVGSLVRSLGVASYRLPHTGAMRYDDQVPKVPSAAVAAEDAELIHRLLAQGSVRLKLSLPCRKGPDRESANVVGEIPGRELPGEIVLIGGHLDSWDLGTGAVDDGAGIAMVLSVGRAILRAGLLPRRTLRIVLFANEENGLRGAEAYEKAHHDEIPRHVAALEADSGAGRPRGFRTPTEEGARLLAAIAEPLSAIGAGTVTAGDAGGADLHSIEDKVPILQMIQDTSRYFEWHHSMADTLDKIDPVELNLAATALAVVTGGLLDGERTLPRPAPRAGP